MPENPLEVRLEATDQGSNHFILVYNSSQYPVTLNPEANVTFSDWLRRLSPVLAGHKDPSGELTQEVLLRNVGTWLWQALFPDTAPAQQRDALMQALRSGHSSLLLTLPDKLISLPWELLCDPEQPAEKGFLALRRPLMRLIASDTPVSPIEPPLRVLVLISSPPSLKEDSRVDVESERAAIEQATHEMREAGLLHLLVEDIVTPKRVQQLLMRFRPHIVHYIGHGGYYEKTGGVLLWEDERGEVLPIYDRRLADILRARNIYAVILRACETGKSNARMDVHGVAGTLVKEGIPAVLAQQGNFTYESSQSASEVWYTALTSGRGMAEALFEVRRALSLADRPDWAVPILRGSTASLVPVLDTSVPVGLPDPQLSSQGVADLPTPTGVFVGRHRELRELRLMLESLPGSGSVLALITGPGGIGKSTLAAQAVTRYGAKYKAVLMLSCLGYQSVDLFLQRIGEFLKRHEAPGFLEQTLPDPKLSRIAKIEEAITVLNQTGPFLLVVDNLESVQEDQTLRDEGLLQLLQKLLTNLRGGRVLITGRYAVKDLLPSGKFAAHLLRIDLDDLSRYETNQLLMRHPSLAHLGEIVRQTLIDEFGGLPYVYDLLSSQAASQSLDLLIHDVQRRITEERKQNTAAKWQEIRQQVIEFAALEATINRLEEPSRKLLAQLGVLQRPFPLAAIEQGLGATQAEWQPLLDWSLLYYDQWQRAYHLHSITRSHVKDLLDEQDRKQTQAKLAAWYQRYASDESHDLADMLEAHRLLRACGEVRQAGELVMRLAEPLMRSGLYPLLHELCTVTLADIGGSDEGLVASTQDELGNVALLQGNYEEARRFYQQSLKIKERLGDQSGQGATLHNLGLIAKNQGDYEQAKRLYQQSLEIDELLDDQGGRANALYSLGIVAGRQGNYEKAQKLLKQSLEIFEHLEDQKGRAGSLGQLGMLAVEQGKYEEARVLYERSLEIEDWLGNQNGRANSLGQLGNWAYLQEKYEEAKKFYEQSLEIFEHLKDQKGRASSLGQLGMLAMEQGEYEEARVLYERSLEIEDRLGNQNGRANSLGQLGHLAYLQEKYEEAQQLLKQSLEIFEHLGDPKGQAGSLGQLGMLANQQGDLEQALTYLVQAYILLDSLRSPGRDTAQHEIAKIRGQMDEATFTRHWKAIAGDLPLPDFSLEDVNPQASGLSSEDASQQGSDFSPENVDRQIMHTLVDFVQAPTWEESKRIVELHPELLQREVEVGLHQWAMQQDDDGARQSLEEYRRLLIRCGDVGIDAAFAGLQGVKSPEVAFAATLNRICSEVVLALRSGDVGRQKMLANQIAQILSENVPIEGAADFLQLLVVWLHGLDIQPMVEKLQPVYHNAYLQMVAVLQEEEIEIANEADIDEGNAVSVDDLPRVVSSLLLQGTAEQRQQFAEELTKAQQQVMLVEIPLARFFGCLAAVLRGETPDVASLMAPYTDLWQELQDALATSSGELAQQQEARDGGEKTGI